MSCHRTLQLLGTYRQTIPGEIGERLLASCAHLEWPADRDFPNDDSDFIAVYNLADEFDVRYFGLPIARLD